jgi:uncharacterized membrane protein
MGVGGGLFGLFVAGIGVFAAGGWVFVASLFGNPPGFNATPFEGVLVGVGMMAGTIAVIALLMLVVIGLINALVWYGRLHYRLLKPAIQS